MNFITRDNKKHNKHKGSMLWILFWILVWQIISFLVGNDLILPSPYSTITELYNLIGTYDFWLIIFNSLMRIVIGFVLSSVLGILWGVLCGLSKTIYSMSYPIIIVIKSTPVASIIILILLWVSKSFTPILVCLLLCFPIVWTNVYEGMSNVDNKLLQMARIYKVSNFNTIINIYLPWIRPYAVAGMITSLGMAWKVSITAELLSGTDYSIGRMIYNSKIYLETQQLFAWTLVIIILSYLIEISFSKLIYKYIGKSKIK
ncbi:MAG: ABC transporter permease [Eubacteriaceae bacterium]